MNADETLRLLSDRMPEMRQRFGVRDLAIFGSVARNEARPDSDLDLLVEFADRPSFDNYMGLRLYLQELFGVRIDLATAGALRKEIRPRVIEETVYVP
jgi:predicted nucleotidyltransferase